MELIYAVLGLLGGVVATYVFLRQKESDKLLENATKLNEINDKISQATEKLSAKQKEADAIVDLAKSDAQKIKDEAVSLKAKAEGKIETLDFKEKDLDKKDKQLEDKIEKLEEAKVAIKEAKKQLDNEVSTFRDKQIEKLEEIAKLTEKEAQDKLIEETKEKSKGIILSQINKIESELKEDAEKKAQKIIALAVQRYSSEVASESTATVVHIESDEMKGRVIGREGRNINALELATGVDIIVDDTPNSIIISGFDLFRRYIAKKSLEKLIEDGRIHPARIEEVVEKARTEANGMLRDLGEKALHQIGIAGVHPDLIKILGRLRFRTSYGQNILKHSLEVGYICAGLAGELGIDTEKAKMAGFFHDIGKAVDHEIEGSHAVIGYEILKKYKIDEEVAYAVGAHHEDMPIKSALDFIVCAADAISGARPGARRETLDSYIKRLRTLEDISTSFEGVEKAFAIQAGREVRIFVKPEEIGDLESKELALNITQKIENDMSYPGQIKVNVIRELRHAEFAK